MVSFHLPMACVLFFTLLGLFSNLSVGCEKVTHMTKVLDSTEMGCEEKGVASRCGDRTDTQIWETEPRNCGLIMVLNQSPNEMLVKSL